MVHPFEYFSFDNFQGPLYLTKEDFWSTLKQENRSVGKINRTQEIIKKFSLNTGIDLTMFYLQMDVLQLADILENFVKTSTEEYGFSPFNSYPAPLYT